MTKWVATIIIMVIATSARAFPIYFAEQFYHTFQELDEALINSEISPEYYDDAIDFGPGLNDDFSSQQVNLTTEYSRVDRGRQNATLRYIVHLTQDLTRERSSQRRDELMIERNRKSVHLGIDKDAGGKYSVRSFGGIVRSRRLKLQIGNLNLRYGNGVTVGHSGLHSELRKSEELNSTFLFPTRNRQNGFTASSEFRHFRVSAFGSRVEGDRHFRQSFGGDFQSPEQRFEYGITLLRQQIGEFDGSRRGLNYIAPHFQFNRAQLRASGESSFQLGAAMAHSYRLETQSRAHRQRYEFFSYSRRYTNVESGGYAYSDYDDETVGGTDLEYRDKRPGRRGIAIEKTIHTRSVGKLSGQLVRWENRNDHRQCVAARLSNEIEELNKHRIGYRIQTQLIWQDLDIENGTDIRKLITIASEFTPSRDFTYSNHNKIEQRRLGSTCRYRFRSRHDLTLRFSPEQQATLTLNYYDSDLDSPNTEQLTLAIAQKSDVGDFGLTSRLQTRYRLASAKLDNWELRINFGLVV